MKRLGFLFLVLLTVSTVTAGTDNVSVCPRSEGIAVVCIDKKGEVILTAPNVGAVRMATSIMDVRPRPRPNK